MSSKAQKDLSEVYNSFIINGIKVIKEQMASKAFSQRLKNSLITLI